MAIEDHNTKKQWLVANYCVAFIDLLGQRNALRDQRLLKPMDSDEQRQEFHATIKASVGAIIKLQERAEEILAPILTPNPS